MGAASEDDGTICVGKASNYRFTGTKNGLELVVPGGQKAGKGKKVTGAEIFFQKDILYGVMTANMKLDSTPGTCQSIVGPSPTAVQQVLAEKAVSDSLHTPPTTRSTVRRSIERLSQSKVANSSICCQAMSRISKL